MMDIANALEKEGLARCVISKHHLDVLIDGFAFRLEIQQDFMMSLLLKQDAALHKTLTKDLYRLPVLHNQLRALHTSGENLTAGVSAMSEVTRLAKLWIQGHCFEIQFQPEVVELLVAYVFVHAYPFAKPKSASTGFKRFLRLLSSFDFASLPIIVDLSTDNPLRPQERALIHDQFDQARQSKRGGALYLVAPLMDETGSKSFKRDLRPFWSMDTREEDIQVLQRKAKASLALLDRLSEMEVETKARQSVELWGACFRGFQEEDFDFVLELRTRKCGFLIYYHLFDLNSFEISFIYIPLHPFGVQITPSLSQAIQHN